MLVLFRKSLLSNATKYFHGAAGVKTNSERRKHEKCLIFHHKPTGIKKRNELTASTMLEQSFLHCILNKSCFNVNKYSNVWNV